MRIVLHHHLLGAAAVAAIAATSAGCEQKDGPPDYTPLCDRALTVAPIEADSQALIVTDPAALSRLQLKDVLQQLLTVQNDTFGTPLGMLQRMFDTSNDQATAAFQNNEHCDSSQNPAHVNGPAAFCPRAEGALAKSTGFFTPGDPDYFYPVAAVNRIDLATPGGDCGQYRIVYAKQSGLTDPNNRVFLIIEATLPPSDADFNGTAAMCQGVAEHWAKIGDETDTAKVADSLYAFYFTGVAGHEAAIRPSHLGLGSFEGGYSGGAGPGQVRVSQHINGEWEYREFHLATETGSDPTFGPLLFIPVPVGNNPIPALFDYKTTSLDYPQVDQFRTSFADMNAFSLAMNNVMGMSMFITPDAMSGESALGGEPINDYAARAKDNAAFKASIEGTIKNAGLSNNCPTDDPLTADSILQRATMQSCAGCHSPTTFLGPERKLGCGVTWPDSLNPAHIDEHGELSPALKEVFLPHRAQVMTQVLQACNNDAMAGTEAAPPGSPRAKSMRPRTLGGSTTH